jgi:endonuclease YncB( thermonuclease family)
MVEAVAVDQSCHHRSCCAFNGAVKRRAPKLIKFETRTMRRNSLALTAKLAGAVFLASVGVGIGSLWLWPAAPALTPEPGAAPTDTQVQQLLAFSQDDADQPRMALCGEGQRVSCVVDGDTIWLRGEKIRVADIDTPEVGEPLCDAEYQLGMSATYRLRDLLNEGPWSVEPIGNRDTDQYDRKLRVLTRGGKSIGDVLVREGLARTWTGQREPWC